MSARRLIVNADDFGRSASINEGIIIGHEHGIITSASLMVRWAAAAAAATYARADASLSVGLHVDLGEWEVDGGEWRQVYTVLVDTDAASVAAELERQLTAFEELMERLPTHLDSHHHVHNEEPARAVLMAAGERLGIPVRGFSPEVAYVGGFYGQYGRGEPYPEGISREHLLALIRGLQPGTSEIGCHPASAPELESSYAHERPIELSVLCDPVVSAALAEERIELCSFAHPAIREVKP
jgi:predicted glycoside hydrolase/deacetylase ChbG (UPF0249 family)